MYPLAEKILSRQHFFEDNRWGVFQDFIADKATPFLVVDRSVLCQRYETLQTLLPMTNIFYAIKANPDVEVLRLFHELGASFDVASIYELQLLVDLGVDARKISYGNTIKKISDISFAYEQGVRMFTTDSEEDLEHLAIYAPKSSIFFRVATGGLGADWPLSRKFGCHQDNVCSLVLRAKEIGLFPYGVTFHVGSQQRDISQWDEGISKCKYLFTMLKEEGIELKAINLGGGLPASYYELTPAIEYYAQEILRYLEEKFEDHLPEILIEPGRYLVADAGTLVSEVILISRKSSFNIMRWVYLDVGKFNGLIETMDELIKYPIFTDKDGECALAILAGPTCDSMDILYERFKYPLPKSLEIGDKVYISTTGAYTYSYSSVGFNGFPPLKTYFI